MQDAVEDAQRTLEALGAPPDDDAGVVEVPEVAAQRRALTDSLAEVDGLLRRASVNVAEAERLLKGMDEIYDTLVTFDFPDAITGGLRRRVDQFRGVLERTRGDLTNSLRQDLLIQALHEFEERVNSE